MPVRPKIGAMKKKDDEEGDNKSVTPRPQSHADLEPVKKGNSCCGAGGPDPNDEMQLVLRVHIIGAKNLAAKDEPEDKSQSIWGLSDPYCIVKCGTEEMRTCTFEKELSPEWNTVMEFTNFEPETCYREFYEMSGDGTKDLKRESALSIAVYDWDEGQMDADDLIGTAQLPFPFELWEKRHDNPAEVFDEIEHTLHDGTVESRYVVKKEAWGASGMSDGERPGSELMALDLKNFDEDPDQKEFHGVVLLQCMVMHRWQMVQRTKDMYARQDEERKVQEKKRLEMVYTLNRALSDDTRDSGPNLDTYSSGKPKQR